LIVDGAEPGLPTYTKSTAAVQMLEIVIVFQPDTQAGNHGSEGTQRQRK
jgi:hypothetical protein